MGNEDTQIILPAITKLQAAGINATGPHPADTLFHSEARKTYDAVLGMSIDFFGGVNVTLGLDFIRTSPDHGTGLDIAGRGIARADSLIAAIKMARNFRGFTALAPACRFNGYARAEIAWAEFPV